jgi:hypothetical protein
MEGGRRERLRPVPATPTNFLRPPGCVNPATPRRARSGRGHAVTLARLDQRGRRSRRPRRAHVRRARGGRHALPHGWQRGGDALAHAREDGRTAPFSAARTPPDARHRLRASTRAGTAEPTVAARRSSWRAKMRRACPSSFGAPGGTAGPPRAPLADHGPPRRTHRPHDRGVPCGQSRPDHARTHDGQPRTGRRTCPGTGRRTLPPCARVRSERVRSHPPPATVRRLRRLGAE